MCKTLLNSHSWNWAYHVGAADKPWSGVYILQKSDRGYLSLSLNQSSETHWQQQQQQRRLSQERVNISFNVLSDCSLSLFLCLSVSVFVSIAQRKEYLNILIFFSIWVGASCGAHVCGPRTSRVGSTRIQKKTSSPSRCLPLSHLRSCAN